jgi:hypothetical protein
MRQVRVQGCLPTLAVLVVIAALGAVAFTAGLAVVVVTAALLLALALVRGLRRLAGAGAPPPRPGQGRVVVESVAPGWLDREGGPVVEAGPREAAGPAGEPPREGPAERLPPGPGGAGEREPPARG